MRLAFASVCACLLFLATAQIGASQAELPTWQVGDSWAMGNDDFDLSFSGEITGMTCDYTGTGSYYAVYEVVEDTGTEYVMDATGGMDMVMDMDIGGSYLGEPLSGSVRMDMVLKMDATMYYTKDELAGSRVDLTMDMDIGFSGSASAAGQSESISGNMKIVLDMNVVYDPALDLFDFPIEVGENWTAESTGTLTGSVTGTSDIPGMSEGVTEPLDQTLDAVVSVSCPETVEISPGLTCYKLVMSSTGMGQAGSFMSAGTQYYSPDEGYIVGQEIDFADTMGAATAGTEGSVPYLGGISEGEGTITLSAVSVEEATRAIEGMGHGGTDVVMVGAIAAVVIAVVVGIVLAVRSTSKGERETRVPSPEPEF